MSIYTAIIEQAAGKGNDWIEARINAIDSQIRDLVRREGACIMVGDMANAARIGAQIADAQAARHAIASHAAIAPAADSWAV